MALFAAACATTPAPRIALSPCTIDEAGAAQCGTLAVPENWSEPRGRKIDLNVVVLPATSAGRNDPIYILQGGPGQAATSLASFYAETYATSRATRDIVLADQRGTGKSAPLQCASRGALDLFAIEEMRACRDALVGQADLRRYTTREAVKDIEAIRKALGYDQLNLYGTSYGTRLAMAYATAYPSRARTMTLKGVLAPDVVAPAGFAEDTERALQLTIDDCAADPVCNQTYPTLTADLDTMRARLIEGPLNVTVEGSMVTLTRGLVGAVLRSMLQSTPGAADIPRLARAAASGDWLPLATTVRTLRLQASKAVYTGLMLSVLCSEDVPFLGETGDVSATFLGTYWLDQSRAVCAEWPHAPMRAYEPATLTVPTLLISGYLDPATPPAAADRAARYFPRSRHVVARYGSHSFSGMRGCIDVLMNRFVETADPAALDDSCAPNIRRPAWK